MSMTYRPDPREEEIATLMARLLRGTLLDQPPTKADYRRALEAKVAQNQFDRFVESGLAQINQVKP